MSKLVILSWSLICTSIQHLLHNRNKANTLIEANTLGSRLEEGVCSSRSICSENWEQNCDRYHTCPEYFRNSIKVWLINMALIAEVCWKRVCLLSGHSSSNIQMITFNLLDSLKSKIFGALPWTPLGRRLTVPHPPAPPTPPPQTPQLRYLPVFSSFRLERLHGVTRKRSAKRLKDTGNLFRENLQLIVVC